MKAKTLYDKLWDDHVVHENEDGTVLIYIDRHLINEVTSPQAFERIREFGRKVWKSNANLATADHNVPTKDTHLEIKDDESRIQVHSLDTNCSDFEIELYKMNDLHQGIVHVIGPESGSTLPGMSVVCGDSHTATHGAYGALAYGIGTSEVEHVLVTQCLIQRKMKNMLIRVSGTLQLGVTAKDLILAIIRTIGTSGGTGYAIEFAGETIKNLSIEERMTVCNMAIEAGARVGLISVDEKTIEYFKGTRNAPNGVHWQLAVQSWRNLHSDPDAHFDKIVEINADIIEPQISWGTSPEMVIGVSELLPNPAYETDRLRSKSMKRSYEYMGLEPNKNLTEIPIDKVFIGSCTNSRIEDLRAAASILRQRKISPTIKLALVVPGSGIVKKQAEEEGLDKIFIDAGFEWRSPGCSMCLGMNDDKLSPGERCASTSNRNFEGRQGYGGRTHLVSPITAAACAVAGRLVDVRQLLRVAE